MQASTGPLGPYGAELISGLMRANRSRRAGPGLLEALAGLAVDIFLRSLLSFLHSHHPRQGGFLQGLRVAPRGYRGGGDSILLLPSRLAGGHWAVTPFPGPLPLGFPLPFPRGCVGSAAAGIGAWSQLSSLACTTWTLSGLMFSLCFASQSSSATLGLSLATPFSGGCAQMCHLHPRYATKLARRLTGCPVAPPLVVAAAALADLYSCEGKVGGGSMLGDVFLPNTSFSSSRPDSDASVSCMQAAHIRLSSR